MKAKIVVLPGDGIGPEITQEAEKVLRRVAEKFGHDFAFSSELIGGIAIDETGEPLPEKTLSACKASDAVLLGAVGGPKWDDPDAKTRPEKGLLEIRKALGLWSNLRPVKIFPKLASASPLKNERLQGVDLLVVRELTGGIYFGEPRLKEMTPQGERALDTMVYTEPEIRRVVKLGFEIAQNRPKKLLTSIDKANVLESSRLWRKVAVEVSKDFPDVTLEHQLVDSAAMKLVTHPGSFDVIVTSNMFGDIISDEAAVLTGSLGVLPSASLGESGPGLYEPIHGSAPDIAGQGVANPLGTILSAAMLLRHSLKLEKEASAVEQAVSQAIDEGATTKDLGGTLSTSQMGDTIVKKLA